MKKGEYVYRRMKKEVEVKNRTWQAITYKNCFVAQEAITWMAKKDFLPLENISFSDLRRKLRRRLTGEADANTPPSALNTASSNIPTVTPTSTANGGSVSPQPISSTQVSDEKRRLAVEYADKLRRFGYFTHVVDESKPFLDTYLFFRFTKVTKGALLVFVSSSKSYYCYFSPFRR